MPSKNHALVQLYLGGALLRYDDRFTVLPELSLELLSPSTAAYDHGEKKRICEQIFKTSEYFLYVPDSQQLEGYRMLDNAYQRIGPSGAEGRLWSRELELELGVWHGEHHGEEGYWLRLFHSDGRLVPTEGEQAKQADQRAEQADQRSEQERQRAEQERQRAEQADQRAEKERQRVNEAEAELARLRARLAELDG